ncbi:MAG: glycosyl hydrolase family 18 protein [Bacillota bacterium]|nr:glycosyl hydrolase family 18 protein [Bacillota bacterium]
MEVNYRATNTANTTRKKFVPFILILAIALLTFSISFWYFYPSMQTATLNTDQWTIIYKGTLYPGQTAMADNSLYVSISFIQSQLDPEIYWDEEEQTAVITTKDKRISLKTDQLTAYINQNPVNIAAPVMIIEEVPFLPIDLLTQIYSIDYNITDSYKRVVIHNRAEPIATGTVLMDKSFLRSQPAYRSPRLANLSKDQQVVILKEKIGYYLVRTEEGLIGYINKNEVEFTGIKPAENVPEPNYWWRPMGQKINLTWEYVNKQTANPANIGPLPGVNVVSPTWFHLKDEEGNLENNADLRYVNWAHENDMQVWALITNRFDRDLTHAVLSSTETRFRVINQLLVFAELYNLNGINIDFENMHLKDRDYLTQFVRELTPLAHEQGLSISIDVTIRSNSENWSMIYDRKALGQIVDYMAVMTYDEHWAASPKAGSVASLPWVERGLVGILEEVPREKVLLGLPLYTRVWEEASQPDGTVKVSSKALSMQAAEALINENNAVIIYDDQAQQDYSQWTKGGSTFKIWLENDESIGRRVTLARKYNLGGVASWRRGFEKPSIWNVIETELYRK